MRDFAFGAFVCVGIVFVFYAIAVELYTAKGRAVWKHHRRVDRAAAQYIGAGMTPADAQLLAEKEAAASSMSLLQAYVEASR